MTTKKSLVIRLVNYLEQKPLWIVGFLTLCLSFLPCILLGEGALFDAHDTYDGALLTYMLKAKYLFTGADTYPELMNGISTSGMEVPAPLFVILYYFFEPFMAHMMQYIILSVTAFFGMYLCLKRITRFKSVSCLIALLFALLPFAPVYGHSVAGLPLVIYAFICLYEKKHLALSYISIAYFVLASSLVYIGYACISILFVMCCYFFIRKKGVKHFYIGSIVLLVLYILSNLDLIYGTFSSDGFISHRVEFELVTAPFWSSFQSVFLASAELAVSCHYYLIVPIFVLHLIETCRYKHLTAKEKKAYKFISFCLISILLLCLFYAANFWSPIVSLKNLLPTSIKHFQFHRFCFFLPILWYLAAGVSLWEIWEMRISFKNRSLFNCLIPYVKVIAMVLFMAMTIITIRRESIYRWNLNQLNNPSVDYGITFEEYFASQQFEEIKDYIGKPQDSYKVASLGLCPAIPLYNGFYCIDGYSNNYPLSYKHDFRKIIEKEIEKNIYIESYFDDWGSRCYLYSAQTNTSYGIDKGSDFVYTDLELNTDAMKALGCNYLLAAAPIENAKELNLTFLKVFQNDVALYDVYLYELN